MIQILFHFRFLRLVCYRQAFRLIWGYAGNDVQKALPSCIYNSIRGTFPSEDGNYKGFEEEEKEHEDHEVINTEVMR